jgi:hypothetical protein
VRGAVKVELRVKEDKVEAADVDGVEDGVAVADRLVPGEHVKAGNVLLEVARALVVPGARVVRDVGGDGLRVDHELVAVRAVVAVEVVRDVSDVDDDVEGAGHDVLLEEGQGLVRVDVHAHVAVDGEDGVVARPLPPSGRGGR